MTAFTYLVNLFLILIRNSTLDVEDYKVVSGRLAFGYIFFQVIVVFLSMTLLFFMMPRFRRLKADDGKETKRTWKK